MKYSVVLLAVFAFIGATPDPKPFLNPVNAWVHAYNSHQMAFPTDAFTDDCTVIDEFAPFAWAPQKTDVHSWYSRIQGAQSPQARRRILESQEFTAVSAPENLIVSGDIAYLTFHSYWTYRKRDGSRFLQRGLFTVVERKTPLGWRISAQSWGILNK